MDDIERDRISKDLIEFIGKFRNKELTQEDDRKIVEFFISKEYKEKNGLDISEDSLKYLSMGWYIYEFCKK